MKYSYRKLKKDDIDKVLKILNEAKIYMKKNNFHQWTDDYPTRKTFEEDIESEMGYVLVDDKDEIFAYFALFFGVDPLYENIVQGKFSNNYDYSVVHRVMIGDKYRGRKLSKYIFESLYEIVKKKGYNNIKIDTHIQNEAMKKSILNEGFIEKAVVKIYDQTLRTVYEKDI